LQLGQSVLRLVWVGLGREEQLLPFDFALLEDLAEDLTEQVVVFGGDGHVEVAVAHLQRLADHRLQEFYGLGKVVGSEPHLWNFANSLQLDLRYLHIENYKINIY